LEVGGDDSSKWPVPGDPVNPVSHLQKKLMILAGRNGGSTMSAVLIRAIDAPSLEPC
jgi:hypothetical protein